MSKKYSGFIGYNKRISICMVFKLKFGYKNHLN